MTLYRLVVSLQPDYAADSRGAAVCQQTHWVTAESNGLAMECGQSLARHIFNPLTTLPTLYWYWSCFRGANRIHSVTVERWSPAGREEIVGRHWFGVPPLPEASISTDLPFTSVGVGMVPTMRGAPRAVTVETEAFNGTKRRSYVGPVSPFAVGLDISVPVLGALGKVLTPIVSPIVGTLPDYNRLPGDDQLPGLGYDADYWPEGMAGYVASWVTAIDEAIGDAGTYVVKTAGGVSQVRRSRGSNLVAHLTSRAGRGQWEA